VPFVLLFFRANAPSLEHSYSGLGLQGTIQGGLCAGGTAEGDARGRRGIPVVLGCVHTAFCPAAPAARELCYKTRLDVFVLGFYEDECVCVCARARASVCV